MGCVSHFQVGATIAFRACRLGLLTAVVVADLATPAAAGLATSAGAASAAFGILVRLQITHLGLVLLFFAHITFLQLFFRFWVVSVAPKRGCRAPIAFSFGIRSSISLSLERFCRRAPGSAEAAFFFPSTNSRCAVLSRSMPKIELLSFYAGCKLIIACNNLIISVLTA